MTTAYQGFIRPDRTLETSANPVGQLGIKTFSGFRAVNSGAGATLLGQNRIFDAIWRRWQETPLECEDQCSPQYYFDLVRTLRDFNGQFAHVVEVGCYLGGATSILAGLMDKFDFTLDVVDVDISYLRATYERVRRMYPQAAARIRLFHGDLPSYVSTVMRAERRTDVLLHHDGSHRFEQVVRDMASLYYVQDQLFAIIAQDTHLRGSIKNCNFVDLALYAVFGRDLNYCPIGAAYIPHDPVTEPNKYQGNYFLPDQPEGFVLPMSVNAFHYPHPHLPMEDFLPPPITYRLTA